MGTDIHGRVEIRGRLHGTEWINAKVGSLNLLDRDYDVFGLLARVRRNDPRGIERRGFPADAAYRTFCAYYDTLVVPDGSEEVGTHYCDGSDIVSETEARGLAEKCGGDIAERYGTRRLAYGFHSPSWVTSAELRGALARIASPHPDWLALLMVMETYEESGCDCRFVFWFDS